MMSQENQFKQISKFEWEIPQQGEMNVPVRVFANKNILKTATGDESMRQAMNAAALPGVLGQVNVMPDVHQGYGFPIGGVAAMDAIKGVISPGAIGYDINCGVRLLNSNIHIDEAENWIDDLILGLDEACPSGMKRKSNLRLSPSDIDDVLEKGSGWLKKSGMVTEQDLDRTETAGCLPFANPDVVSARAKQRGLSQLGTLGSGNHFLEIGMITDVFDEEAAEVMGLFENHLTVMIHCGSRGLGHQVCSDYLQILQGYMKDEGIQPPNRDLSYAYLESKEGQEYLAAMGAAANYAFANRQVLATEAEHVFERIMAGKVKNPHLSLVYDVAHNMGNIETHTINGEEKRVCIHRKGATRAFGPGHKSIPVVYQKIGQPVLVPGSMGTESWVLVGTEEGMLKSFGSSCHGAGRLMSRKKAKSQINSRDLLQELRAQGINIRTDSIGGLAEEAPDAYKDVNDVVASVAGAGIARKVARIVPLAVIKG
jgi:tRNA-splicing ligase RtcB